jgi:hypothetical protein
MPLWQLVSFCLSVQVCSKQSNSERLARYATSDCAKSQIFSPACRLISLLRDFEFWREAIAQKGGAMPLSSVYTATFLSYIQPGTDTWL